MEEDEEFLEEDPELVSGEHVFETRAEKKAYEEFIKTAAKKAFEAAIEALNNKADEYEEMGEGEDGMPNAIFENLRLIRGIVQELEDCVYSEWDEKDRIRKAMKRARLGDSSNPKFRVLNGLRHR